MGDASSLDVVDDIDRHLKEALEFDRAALIPGMYLAWCARLNLLDVAFAKAQANALLRLHYNDGSCTELLITGCSGTLRYSHLNQRGIDFTRSYYPRYFADWQAVFGDEPYAVTDSWDSYNKIAPVLTAALLGSTSDARVNDFGVLNTLKAAMSGKRSNGSWWKFWKK